MVVTVVAHPVTKGAHRVQKVCERKEFMGEDATGVLNFSLPDRYLLLLSAVARL